MIGPHRASRTKAVAGIPTQPHTFFIGVVNGGVWKTTDAGRTWTPIFDDQPTGAIGSIAIAPSQPSVIYVGTGEAQQRPDLAPATVCSRQTAAARGRIWDFATQQISQIIVDPANPNRLFVAALGHPYRPNEERGIFRSLDGGQTFQKVLYKTRTRAGPTSLSIRRIRTSSTPCYGKRDRGRGERRLPRTRRRSVQIDRWGNTWRPLTKGLPTWNAIDSGASASRWRRRCPRDCLPWSKRARGGRYLSLGRRRRSWSRVNSDPRVVARPNDATDVRVHPVRTSSMSHDRGVEVDGRRKKPSPHFAARPAATTTRRSGSIPMPDVMIMTSDQGAVVTLNGGESWSSW